MGSQVQHQSLIYVSVVEIVRQGLRQMLPYITMENLTSAYLRPCGTLSILFAIITMPFPYSEWFIFSTVEYLASRGAGVEERSILPTPLPAITLTWLCLLVDHQSIVDSSSSSSSSRSESTPEQRTDRADQSLFPKSPRAAAVLSVSCVQCLI